MKRFWILLMILIAITLTSCGSIRKTTYANVSYQLEDQFKIYKNTPYQYGGTTKSGFDCSGYVVTVYKNAFNIQLPRTTQAMMKEGTKVHKKHLQPGDLLFFKPSRSYKHVGIYVGNNLFMHSSTSKGVIKSNINNPYWKKKYRFAKRILKVK